MGKQLNTKKLFLIVFVLSSVMVLSLFQNCSTNVKKIEQVKIKPVQQMAPIIREPASDLSDMINASDREIVKTKRSLNSNLDNEGGFGSGQNRQVANKEDSDSTEEVAPIDKDNLVVKLKTKKLKKHKH